MSFIRRMPRSHVPTRDGNWLSLREPQLSQPVTPKLARSLVQNKDTGVDWGDGSSHHSREWSQDEAIVSPIVMVDQCREQRGCTNETLSGCSVSEEGWTVLGLSADGLNWYHSQRVETQSLFILFLLIWIQWVSSLYVPWRLGSLFLLQFSESKKEKVQVGHGKYVCVNRNFKHASIPAKTCRSSRTWGIWWKKCYLAVQFHGWLSEEWGVRCAPFSQTCENSYWWERGWVTPLSDTLILRKVRLYGLMFYSICHSNEVYFISHLWKYSLSTWSDVKLPLLSTHTVFDILH